ncbi:MAG: hypothetical protein WA459_06805 [Stellaceae bacterium]
MNGHIEADRASPAVARWRRPAVWSAWLTRKRVGLGAAILLALQLAGFLFIIAGTHGWIVPLPQPTTTDFASFYAAGTLANERQPALAYDRTVALPSSRAAAIAASSTARGHRNP